MIERESLRLEWPDEAQREIVALRIAPRGDAGLHGRILRQAFAAEGLVHGPLDIFHWATSDGRVAFSAANLRKPGVYQLGEMDTARYDGVNLFAVLPGPLPAAEAFDEMLGAARGLALRLDAEVCDSSGAPLSAERIATLRGSPTADPEA